MSSRTAPVLAVLAAACAATAVGAALAAGRPALAALFCVAPFVVLAGARAAPSAERLLDLGGSRTVGAAWVVLVVSTFVWRTRTTEALVSNPLDSAALIRVALVATAGFVLLLCLLQARAGARLPLPVILLVGFTAVALVSAVGSPLPRFALYRVVELSVGLAAVAAVASLPASEWRKALDLVLACLGAILAIVWLEALAMPSHGWETASGVLDHALVGYFPSFSSNSLGVYGAVLGIWGIAHLDSPLHRRSVVSLAAIGGVATLLAAQYRTGIIGFLLALTYVVWERRRLLLAGAVLAATLLIVASGDWASIRERTEVVFARGNPGTIANLNSRALFWHAAEPSIRERPVFGWGLNVGTRQVLSSLGLESTSTIHSTWFEALLGTGVVGTALLAAAYLALLAAALARSDDPERPAIVGIVIVLLVRSLTGSTIELFDVLFLLFGALALAARAPPRAVARERS